MASDKSHSEKSASPRQLSDQARRALQEAEQRRQLYDQKAASLPPEFLGRDGPEPIRYGDWENKGIATDF
jgi:hypothetical protein